MPDDLEAFETVLEECKPILPFRAALSVATLIRQWKTTHNPHFVDAAVQVCADHGIAPPDSVLSEISQVAGLRLQGEATGTAVRVFKGGLLDNLLLLMANLHILADVPLHLAARKAQAWQPGMQSYKASTLERYYGKRIAGSALEESIRRNAGDPTVRDTWQQIANALPEAREDESGERR